MEHVENSLAVVSRMWESCAKEAADWLLFTPEPRTCCGAAGEHDSGGSLDFAKRIFMSELPVTGHGVNSNAERFGKWERGLPDRRGVICVIRQNGKLRIVSRN